MNIVKLRLQDDLALLFDEDFSPRHSPVTDLLRTGKPLVIDSSLEPINLNRYERIHNFSVPVFDILRECCKEAEVPFSNIIWVTPIDVFEFERKYVFNGTLEEYYNSRSEKFPFSTNVSRCFLSLNNYPRKHRKEIVEFIERNGIAPNSFYSYNPREYANEKSVKLDDQFANLDSVLSGLDSLGAEIWKTTFVSIVTETLFEENLFFPTEKTWKVFDKFHIPIFVSTPKFVEQLRDMGFDVFDDYVDHSYDNIECNESRLSFIFDEIKKWSKVSIKEISEIKHLLKERLIANQNHLNRLMLRKIHERNLFLESLVSP